jgi:ABC-type Fe3+-hydroxamate transport system substrate-binding protein
MDDLGREVVLPGPARRIICLVPSITETLFAFGAGDRVAGVTDYCIHPAAGVAGKPRLGGTKNADLDKILGLRPDLVIANVEENRRHQIQKLENAGITVFVTFPKTVDGAVKMMRDMAALTDAFEAAEPVLRDIEEAQAVLQSRAPTVRPRVLCLIWKNPYMSINRDTFVDSIMRECGGRNVFEDRVERYPVIDISDAAAQSPEVILLPTEPYHFVESDKPEFDALGDVPAVRNGRVHIVEGELLSWYGPRIPRALREVSALIHTDCPKK